MLKTLNINRYLESSLFKIVLDEDGDILDMTEAVKLLMPKDFIPHHISEIFDQSLLEQIKKRLLLLKTETIADQNVLIGHLEVPNKKSEPCYIIYQQYSGRAILTIKIGEQSYKLNQLYESAYLKATMPMALVNESGYIISTNDLFLEIFPDQTSSELIHLQDLFYLMVPTSPFTFEEYILKALTQESSTVKMSYTSKGIQRYQDVSLTLDYKTQMFILRIVDITEQERLFEQLAHSDQLCTTGEIAASIAHEVRNPMTTLQGFLQLLEHEVTGNAQMYVKVIQDEVKRMNEILNEMLVLSKPAVDEITIFSLSVLVEEVLILLRPKALLDQIHLVNEFNAKGSLLIQANPNRVKQVFINLLKNAMEAMKANDTLSIMISEGHQQNVDIFISDTGAGMGEEMLETIFLPFVTDKPGGTGLGLPFVKKTVQEHGGSISVTSEIGKGTVFHLSFPLIPVIV
ncbi:hypothetical protein CSV80_12855 [Sporosarcina sp. P12(2017)]|uniref:two-component system sensor histidine kinase NtrB n=1 Tax=unclassified Sporosarcina TaxID=2647733 RepID=UPI000C164279|nr:MULTISPECIES: ATP-binding protein [unclassified Sporosarcina]PIC56209.1 hypothetical protein CSV81_15420 [Sporosarcina sp. P10]PIC60120.1 hypothetical protein CSV80_12855 [Sporosarcina sp. P12(2017)]